MPKSELEFRTMRELIVSIWMYVSCEQPIKQFKSLNFVIFFLLRRTPAPLLNDAAIINNSRVLHASWGQHATKSPANCPTDRPGCVMTDMAYVNKKARPVGFGNHLHAENVEREKERARR